MKWARIQVPLALPRALVRDTTLNYGSSVFAGALQLIILVLLTRTLTKPAVGVIVLSTAISSTIATAAEFGLGPLSRPNTKICAFTDRTCGPRSFVSCVSLQRPSLRVAWRWVRSRRSL